MVLTSTDIDDNYKVMFEASKKIHGKTLKDIFNTALKDFMIEHDPEKALEEEMVALELRLSEIRMELTKIRHAKKHLKDTIEEANEVDEYLENVRSQKFEKFKKSIIVQWNKGNLDWSRIVEHYQFKSKSEAKEWFTKRMVEEGVV